MSANTEAVARNILVFGRGLEISDGRIELSTESVERVDATMNYLEDNYDAFEEQRGRVAFSCGYAGVGLGLEPVPYESREASQMFRMAQLRGLDEHNVDVWVGADSTSTLEDALRAKESGFFDGITFTPDNPLGIVGQKGLDTIGHIHRMALVTSCAFRIGREAIKPIIAAGDDIPASGISEKTAYYMYKIGLFGARTPDSMRQRERLLAAGNRLARNLHGLLPVRASAPE